jgi:phosphoribosylformylglycinamidine synthase II
VDIPVDPIAKNAPELDRPLGEPADRLERQKLDLAAVAPETEMNAALEALLDSPNLGSKAWLYRQYDQLVQGDTVIGPGGDAALVRVRRADGSPTAKGVALSVDCNPRWCWLDPYSGTLAAVAEAARNVACTGARPLALTNCLNFGNPEKPEIMWEFAEATRGLRDAAHALGTPVVSGNVSLYNETNGVAIPPTPAIGGVGVVPDVTKMAGIALRNEGDTLLLLGEENGHLGQSLYMDVILDRREGAPPPVDLDAEKRTGDFVRALIRDGAVTAVHDVSDGGLLVAIAEMALAGGVGVELAPSDGPLPGHAIAFGEDQSRYVVAVSGGAEEIENRARDADIPVRVIGKSGGNALCLPGEAAVPLSRLRDLHEVWLPRHMGAI